MESWLLDSEKVDFALYASRSSRRAYSSCKMQQIPAVGLQKRCWELKMRVRKNLNI